MLFSPADEGDRLALEVLLKPEQDVQPPAKPSASNVAPATLAPRKHFVILTGRPFLPCPGTASRVAAESLPQPGDADWRRLLPRGEDLLRPESLGITTAPFSLPFGRSTALRALLARIARGSAQNAPMHLGQGTEPRGTTHSIGWPVTFAMIS